MSNLHEGKNKWNRHYKSLTPIESRRFHYTDRSQPFATIHKSQKQHQNTRHLQSASYQFTFCTCLISLRHTTGETCYRGKSALSSWQKLLWLFQRGRVIFVESPALRVRAIIKFFRVKSELSDDLVESSHKNCQVTSSHWFASSSQGRVHES